ncbi:MAG: hypothetical protein JNL88_05985 [Bacteroidia bacterium]|nr:hypothetical protein [Bacteroidia bacterium]
MTETGTFKGELALAGKDLTLTGADFTLTGSAFLLFGACFDMPLAAFGALDDFTAFLGAAFFAETLDFFTAGAFLPATFLICFLGAAAFLTSFFFDALAFGFSALAEADFFAAFFVVAAFLLFTDAIVKSGLGNFQSESVEI